MFNTKPDADREVDDLIRRSTQVDVPIEVEERLRRRIAEFQTKIEQPQPLMDAAVRKEHASSGVMSRCTN